MVQPLHRLLVLVLALLAAQVAAVVVFTVARRVTR